MANLLVLSYELEAIQSFISRVFTSVDHEYSGIVRESEAGAFADEDDEANASFLAMQSEEIAIRSALGELNALVEWELQIIASKPYLEQQEGRPSKRRRSVHDLKWPELHHLIEDYYQFKIADLPAYQDVEEMRKIVNAYKHRKGFKDPRRELDWTQFLERYELERENVFRYIQAVKEFLKAIWSATNVLYLDV